jgi:hypothetical protein
MTTEVAKTLASSRAEVQRCAPVLPLLRRMRVAHDDDTATSDARDRHPGPRRDAPRCYPTAEPGWPRVKVKLRVRSG